MICDNETGQCLITPGADTKGALPEREKNSLVTVHYVGDPMCSWCWGIANSVRSLAQLCQQRGFQFVLTNGGLRAGGGDKWNAAFRNFLRHEWQQINLVTGQPFSYSLLELEFFNYDTEPACRAVVSASLIRPESKLHFFHETQKKFYTESADPKLPGFYQSICEESGIDFADFKKVFESKAALLETYNEFRQARAYGVNAFPSILVEKSGVMQKVITGYSSEEEILRQVLEAQARKN